MSRHHTVRETPRQDLAGRIPLRRRAAVAVTSQDAALRFVTRRYAA